MTKVRPGYQQTEAGVIPADWEVHTVREILHLRRGRVISHNEIARNPGTYPVYSSQTKNNGVMGHLSYFEFDGQYLTWTTDGANAGTVFFRNGKFNCTNVCGTGRDINENRSTVKFLAYYLNTVSKEYVSYVGNPKLMSGVFGSIPSLLPPLPEQHAIAEALGDADALIEALEALIAKKRSIKQGAMQDLLTGHRRLPGFQGEWTKQRLGVCAAIRNEKVQTYGNRIALRCIEMDQISSSTGRVDRLEDATTRYSIKYRFQPGDVLFGRLRPYLRKYWFADVEGVCSTEIWPLTSLGERMDQGFLFFTVQTEGFIDAASAAYGTHMPRADWKMISDYQLALPPTVAEQRAIATVLSDMDAEISALEDKLAKTRAMKQGMMQLLLTGEIRLI